MTVRLSMAGFRSSLPFSALIRQVEQEMETVIKVLQPGPLGIIEHKFSADEIRKANATVSKAVINWRRNAALEDNNHILKDYINKIDKYSPFTQNELASIMGKKFHVAVKALTSQTSDKKRCHKTRQKGTKIA